MDIVNMLNELYHRFDTHSNTHDVYKVRRVPNTFNMGNKLIASFTSTPTLDGGWNVYQLDST